MQWRQMFGFAFGFGTGRSMKIGAFSTFSNHDESTIWLQIRDLRGLFSQIGLFSRGWRHIPGCDVRSKARFGWFSDICLGDKFISRPCGTISTSGKRDLLTRPTTYLGEFSWLFYLQYCRRYGTLKFFWLSAPRCLCVLSDGHQNRIEPTSGHLLRVPQISARSVQGRPRYSVSSGVAFPTPTISKTRK